MRHRGVSADAHFALALALACLVLGCGRVRDTRACRSAVALINPGLDEIEVLARRDDPASERKIAERYEDLARKLGAIAPASSALDGALEEYGSVFRDASTQVRNHAEASERAQAPKSLEARRELERLRIREKAATVRFRVECRG